MILSAILLMALSAGCGADDPVVEPTEVIGSGVNIEDDFSRYLKGASGKMLYSIKSDSAIHWRRLLRSDMLIILF